MAYYNNRLIMASGSGLISLLVVLDLGLPDTDW